MTVDPKDIKLLREAVSGSKSKTKALDNILANIGETEAELMRANLKITRLHNANDILGRWGIECIDKNRELERVLQNLGVIVNEGASM